MTGSCDPLVLRYGVLTRDGGVCVQGVQEEQPWSWCTGLLDDLQP